MAADFDLTALALEGCCPGNVIKVDDVGLPSIMVRIPKLTYKQLGMGDSEATHPAFIVDGQEIDEILISKYQNVVNQDRAYSLGGVDPRANITFDKAREVCENKGEGWHLMTRMEWGLLVRWCQKNGVMPKGNNNFGKHSSESVYKAIPTLRDNAENNHRPLRVATGTGPLTWYHDQTPSGIADLCGNVWEWSGGIRCIKGELQVLANNNAANLHHSQSDTSTEWKAIKASDGTLIAPNGSGTTSGSIKMDIQSNKLVYNTTKTGNTGNGSDSNYSSCKFSDITCVSGISAAAKLLLQNLGFLQYNTGELFADQYLYWNNVDDERCFFSGGTWYNTPCGLASFHGSDARSTSDASIGFRSAYIQLPA